MSKLIKRIIKYLLYKTSWRLKKIYKNKGYVHEKPNLDSVLSLYNSKGIIHMGAHRGQEAPVYDWFNKKTIWIEANPNLLDYLEDNISQYINQNIIHALLSDQDKVMTKFYISNNDGASSSIFKLGEAKSHSKIKMTSSTNIESTKFDTLVAQKQININEYDFWVMDLQGAELLALRGAVDSLKNCKFIYCEISKENIYLEGAKWGELKKFLGEHGFFPSWEPESSHTDILFYKKNNL